MKSEKEILYQMKFKKHLEKRHYEDALKIIDENPDNDYWYRADIQKHVQSYGDVHIIKRFAKDYNLVFDWSILIIRKGSDWKLLFEFIDENNYKIPKESLMQLFDRWVGKDDEIIMWITNKLDKQNSLPLIMQYINKVKCKEAFKHYKLSEVLIDKFPAKEYPDFISCLFGFNDLKYSMLMKKAIQKGYNLDLNNNAWKYIDDILYNKQEPKNSLINNDTRPERIDILKQLGLKMNDQNYNQIGYALSQKESYSKQLLDYMTKDKAFDINRIIDIYGNTILIKAIKNGNNEIVEDLLNAGADVNAGKKRSYEGNW